MVTSKSDDEKDAIIDKFRIIGYGCIALLLYVALAFFFPLQDPSSSSPPKPGWVVAAETTFNGFSHVIVEARAAFGSALVGFFALSAVLQVLQYTSLKRQVRETLSDTISMNEEFFQNLSPESMNAFLQNSMRTIMGDEIGSEVFRQMQLFLSGDRSFRREFRYHIAFKKRGERPANLSPAIESVFGDVKYRWVEERISYKRFFPKEQSEDRDLEPIVSFAFDDRSYEDLFSSTGASIFYRLIMNASPQGLARIANLTQEELNAFVTRDCRLRIERVRDGNTPDTFDTVIGFDSESASKYPVIQIRGTGLSLREDDTIRVSLCYPYDAEVGRYTVTLPDPCDSPRILFQAASDMEVVDTARFMTSIDGRKIDQDQPNSGGSHHVEVLDSWIFPTSGVSFFWKETEV